MLKRFLEKSAAKASLYNIGCDIRRLYSSFPQNPKEASKGILLFIENCLHAFSNGSSRSDISDAIVKAASRPSDQLWDIVRTAFSLAEFAHNNDQERLVKCDRLLSRRFFEATGTEIDKSQASWYVRFLEKHSNTVSRHQQDTEPSVETDAKVSDGMHFLKVVRERLTSGEIVNDLNALADAGETAARNSLIEGIEAAKKSMEWLEQRGILPENSKKALHLARYLLASEPPPKA